MELISARASMVQRLEMRVSFPWLLFAPPRLSDSACFCAPEICVSPFLFQTLPGGHDEMSCTGVPYPVWPSSLCEAIGGKSYLDI